MADEFWGGLVDKGVIPLLTVAITVTASLLIGLFSVCASIMISFYTSQQTRALAEDQRDADLLSRFAEFHVSDDDRRRRFSVYIVERMKGPGWRRGLREFIIFDTLSRHFDDSMPVAPFDRNRAD